MSVPVASLCDHCRKIFQHPISVDEEKVLLRSEDVLTISSRLWCRLCAIIDTKLISRHFDQEWQIYYEVWDLESGLSLRLSAHSATTVHGSCIDLNLRDPDKLDGIKCEESIPDTTKAASSFQFCVDQLQNCLKNHAACRTKTISRHLADDPPSRLLYVAGPDRDKVYLRTTDDLRSDSIAYLTLSHCWGKSNVPLLNKSTFDGLTDGIAATSLPKTFRDAVQITRDLGFEYLWIDSLCIFQDSRDDWNHESSKMCEVYANAVCNISATGAADSTEGLFFTHRQEVDCSFLVDVHWPTNTVEKSRQLKRYLVLSSTQWEDSVEKQKLNTRAWVMQERVLSKRVISFARDQLFWECLDVHANEAFPNGTPKSVYGEQVYWMYNKFKMKDLLYDLMPNPCESGVARPRSWKSELWHRHMFNNWRTFLISYTRCGLTKPADKLVALRGVAEGFARCMQLNLQEDFVAGLWLPQLGWELCWFVHFDRNPTKPVQWRAPSWSWASIDSQIHPGSIRHHRRCRNIVEEFSLVRIERRLDWSGEMAAVALHLKGKLIPATCTIREPYGDQDGRVRGKCLSIDCENGQSICWRDDADAYICIDTKLRADDGDSGNVHVGNSLMEALVVVPHDTAEGEFVRIGLLSIDNEYVDCYLGLSQLFVERDIVLV
ncbi:hypothetical protein PFICI_06453 [Pestalotiopsis fici W106-1]|uniref:Heterokaryon incompatibility domain-containing protein n=1 Tax=Pestalotiopsis fici (strain W106-1 / CGMCC3.15140) TaxID=1229662 RepID=W3X8D6_PESFW|nr:uncharacterized protein PFICI_06453 [Pestalotiopsis fici W106-1]ETS81451.1 hypothetical protein PFICI_06453 [Pestalotiopsis fici W106-1]